MIRIVTDSAADLTAAELSLPGIFVVPLSRHLCRWHHPA